MDNNQTLTVYKTTSSYRSNADRTTYRAIIKGIHFVADSSSELMYLILRTLGSYPTAYRIKTYK